MVPPILPQGASWIYTKSTCDISGNIFGKRKQGQG